MTSRQGFEPIRNEAKPSCDVTESASQPKTRPSAAHVGWDVGIRTPITASRARCPTVERRPSRWSETLIIPAGSSTRQGARRWCWTQDAHRLIQRTQDQFVAPCPGRKRPLTGEGEPQHDVAGRGIPYLEGVGGKTGGEARPVGGIPQAHHGPRSRRQLPEPSSTTNVPDAQRQAGNNRELLPRSVECDDRCPSFCRVDGRSQRSALRVPQADLAVRRGRRQRAIRTPGDDTRDGGAILERRDRLARRHTPDMHSTDTIRRRRERTIRTEGDTRDLPLDILKFLDQRTGRCFPEDDTPVVAGGGDPFPVRAPCSVDTGDLMTAPGSELRAGRDIEYADPSLPRRHRGSRVARIERQ